MMLLLLCFLFDPGESQRLAYQQSPLMTISPKANSQFYLRSNEVSSYSIKLGNSTVCRFKTSVVPCKCVQQVSNEYSLLDNGITIANFSVLPPDIELGLPSNHELLHELSVMVAPKLCLEEQMDFFLEHRSLETAPGEAKLWNRVWKISSSIHDRPKTLLFPCQAFSDIGVYRVVLSTSSNHTISSSETLVNRSSESSLSLRNDSIFPHCSSEFPLHWSIAKCPALNLQYSIRVLAIPEGNVDHDDRAMYIEEVSIDRSQTSLSISCSQFDIIFEKYCFELVSVNKNTSAFHLWRSSCVSTEPVNRQNGAWSTWGPWSDCSTTCGDGITRRTRACDSPVPMRGRSCVGNVLETKQCSLKRCPEATKSQLPATNCSCGCHLEDRRGSFFATSSAHQQCSGNQTWWLAVPQKLSKVDFTVTMDVGAKGKLFFFLGAPYGELVWFSSSNQGPAFTLPMTRPLYIVLWSKLNATNTEDEPRGFTVTYNLRAADPPPQFGNRPIPGCDPMCPETVIIIIMGILFLLLIFIPPFVCSQITQKMRRNSSPEVPLIDKNNEMIRSGNTVCTSVSHKQVNNNGYIAKRSIGIQLSVQNTPRLVRTTCPSTDSPLPRGASSLSASEELEYDYYDGTTIPGSFLAPVDDNRFSAIDIDDIIAQSRIFAPNPVQTQDVHTQV